MIVIIVFNLIINVIGILSYKNIFNKQIILKNSNIIDNKIYLTNQIIETNKNDSLVDFIAYVINSIDENDGKDLIEKGIKIQDIDKDDQVTLSDKINNKQLVNQILGSETNEDIKLLNRLKEIESEIKYDNEGYDDDSLIDDNLINQIRLEAKLTVDNLRDQNLLFKDLLDGKMNSNEFFNEYDKTANKQLLSDLNKEYINKQLNTITNDQLLIQEDKQKNYQLDSQIDSKFNTSLSNEVIDESETNELSTSPQTALFSQLLKASIADAESQAYADREIEKPLTNLIDNNIKLSDPKPSELDQQLSVYLSSGDSSKLDTERLLGQTLSTLSTQLGIDIKGEILTDGKTKVELQAIMANSMLDLANSLKEIDTERELLINKLNNIQNELRSDLNTTTNISPVSNNVTIDQLDELLPNYISLYENELIISKNKLDNATKTLSQALVEYEYNVGPITALAMFQNKSIDKKLAFLLGLTLFFKIPFDLIKLYLSVDQSIDFTTGFSYFTQTLLCLALFTHYGLFAAWITFKK